MCRYLTYSIDKHQSSPQFRNDTPDWLIENATDGYDVIVDLQEKKRFWLGEWEAIECV